jgi:hypothetical protein
MQVTFTERCRNTLAQVWRGAIPVKRDDADSIHIPRGVRAVAAVALVASIACSEAGGSRDAFAVRDSAGIRIAESSEPVARVSWSVSPQPDVTIGGNEADSMQQLFRVSAALELSNGRIVVSHGPAPMVRWYDRSGEYQTGAGRAGGGPGEFGGGESAWISTMWALAGDSVATWEHPPRRMQVFGPDGEFVRAVVLEIPPDMPPRSYPQIVGRTDNGFIAYLPPDPLPGTLGEIVRDLMPFIGFHGDGEYAGELARLPGFTSYTYQYRTPDGRELPVRGRPPFARLAAFATGPARWYYGSGDAWEIEVRDSTGSLEMLIRRPVAPEPVTSQWIDTYKTETMAGAPADPAGRRLWQEIIDEAPYPDMFPAYRRIRIDRTGLLWVQAYDLPGADSSTWSVFDREGRWLSDVSIPHDWQVLDIGADYMLALVRDELDIERVERHTLNRAAS